jgi:signal transduction histidine kinase
MVQRDGPGLGARGGELANLARAQESALRNLLARARTDPEGPKRDTPTDLRVLLAELAEDTSAHDGRPAVELAVPATPVLLPAAVADELAGAVGAALDNVAKHAGPQARAWMLVEDEPGELTVTVRDNGPGIVAGRLEEAASAGRLGVAQSMRGRVTDLGGTTTVTSWTGKGTEVEFRIPRP